MSSAGTKGRRLVVLALALAGSAAQGAEPAPAAGRATLVVAQDSGGDFRGKDERPIIEALGRAPAGGGTILIKPGIYTLRRAIVLRSRRNLTLVGAPGAVLRVSGRCESVVASDAAEGDKELAVEDSSPFVAGAKVEIQAPAPKPGWKIRTVRGVAEGKLLLASPLDFKCPKGTRVVLAANVIELWGCHGITLVNLTLDGSKPERTKVRDHTHQCGVHGSGVRNIRIVNCTVKNAWHRGISFYGPTAVLVAGCTLRNTDAAINFDHHSYWCQAIENEIEGCGGGVELNDTADCIVARNTIRRCGFGVNMWRWHLTKGPDGKPGTFQNVRNKVLGNTIVAPSTAGIISHGAGHNKIVGNTIEGQGARGKSDGIVLRSPANRVERNTVEAMPGYGIVVEGKGNALIGNRCTGNRAGAFRIEDPEAILRDNTPSPREDN